MTAWISMGCAMIGIAVLIICISAIKDSDDAAWAIVAFGFLGMAFMFRGLFQ